MTTAKSKTTAIAISNSHQSNTIPAPTTKSDKKRLVAQWLVDDNSQLYCQWVTKD